MDIVDLVQWPAMAAINIRGVSKND